VNRNILVCVGICLFVTTGRAEKWKPPILDYSCDTEIISNGSTILSKDYYSASNGYSKSRHEMFGTIIIDSPKSGSFLLLPLQKAYMDQTEPSVEDDLGLNVFEFNKRALGPEVVNGYQTTKYRWDEVSSEGVAYKGFGWVTREKIIVKLDLKYVVEGKSFHTVMQMRNLKIGKLDPGLFEIPKGYKRLEKGVAPQYGDAPSPYPSEPSSLSKPEDKIEDLPTTDDPSVSGTQKAVNHLMEKILKR
jgi:hypothetical protein